jgi:hypothetical protein
MNVHKLIQKRIRAAVGGARVESDVNAAIAANVGEPQSTTQVRSAQHTRVSAQARPEERAGG